MTTDQDILQRIVDEYWLSRLSAVPHQCKLPCRQTYITQGDFRVIRKSIDKDSYKSLNEICGENNMARLIALIGITALFLRSYTQNSHVLFCTPGLKNKTMPNRRAYVQMVMDSFDTFREALNKLKASVIQDLSYATDNYYEIFDTLRQNEVPINDSGYIAWVYTDLQSELPNAHDFPISIYLSDKENGLEMLVSFREALYDEKLVELFAEQYLYLVSNIGQIIDKPIKNACSVKSERISRLLSDFSKTCTKDYPSNTIYGLFAEQAAKTPHNTALDAVGGLISFQELDISAKRVALYLESRGIGQGDIIASMFHISEQAVASFLGIMMLGAVYLPLNHDFPADRKEYILYDSGASCLLTDVHVEEPPKGLTVLYYTDAERYETPGKLKVSGPDPTSLAYIFYTSGSMGVPKGVVIEHRSVVNQMYGLMDTFDFDETLKHVLMAPLTFDPSIQQILLPLITGARLFLPDDTYKKDPQLLAETICDKQINVLNTVPSYIDVLIPFFKKSKLLMKYVIMAGEKLTTATYQNICKSFQVENVINIYGPTEATINTTWYDCGSLDTAGCYDAIPIGKPFYNYGVYILDQDNQLAHIGVAGELCITGIGLARGYLNAPELNHERFCTNPYEGGSRFYKTGDIVQCLPNGNIEFIGRQDNQIKINGRRIDLKEIENCLIAHPEINNAIVLPKEKSAGGIQLLAFIDSRERVSHQDLYGFLSGKLMDFMIPARFFYVSRMPVTHNGKVDKERLLSLAVEDEKANSTTILADTDEKKMISIWKLILENDSIGIDDSFFKAGGNSLDSIRLSYEIQEAFHVTVTAFDLLKYPSVRSLTEFVRSQKKKFEKSIQRVSPKEHYEASYQQYRMWVMHQMKEGFGEYNTTASCKIQGHIDWQCFARAFSVLVKTHESFRTTFEMMNGKVIQRIHEELKYDLLFHDYRGKAEANSLAISEVKRLSNYSFMLQKAPLFQACLICIADDEYIFAVAVHHIITDGWSMQRIAKELFEMYSSIIDGVPLSDTMPKQYKDYTAWVAEQIQSKHMEEYWLKEFDREPAVLWLPADFPRQTVKTNFGSNIEMAFSNDLSVRIERFAQQNEVSLFGFLMTAVYVLLYGYSQQSDIVIGTVSAGRPHKELERIMGNLVNTLPIRMQIHEEKSFEQFMKEVHEHCYEAIENQFYPMDLLFEKLHFKRDVRRSLLFDVAVTLEEDGYRSMLEAASPLKIERFVAEDEWNEHITNIDIGFSFNHAEEAVSCIITYNKALFRPETIILMKEHLAGIIKLALDKKTVSIQHICLQIMDRYKMAPDIDFDL